MWWRVLTFVSPQWTRVRSALQKPVEHQFGLNSSSFFSNPIGGIVTYNGVAIPEVS